MSSRPTALAARRTTASIALVTLAAAAAFSGGCGNSQLREIRNDPTPELDAFARTHDQIENDIAISVDHTERQIRDDFERLFLLDRPARTNPLPAVR